MEGRLRSSTSPDLASARTTRRDATRRGHTFASQWVVAGGSIEKLKEILGHYSEVMTECYAQLRPELFTVQDRAVLPVDLGGKRASVTRIAPGLWPVSTSPVVDVTRKTGAAL